MTPHDRVSAGEERHPPIESQRRQGRPPVNGWGLLADRTAQQQVRHGHEAKMHEIARKTAELSDVGRRPELLLQRRRCVLTEAAPEIETEAGAARHNMNLDAAGFEDLRQARDQTHIFWNMLECRDR